MEYVSFAVLLTIAVLALWGAHNLPIESDAGITGLLFVVSLTAVGVTAALAAGLVAVFITLIWFV